jgi:hypothetical protein
MFIVDALKEIILLCAVVLFAVVLSAGITSWYLLPEHVWHAKGH